MSNLTLRIKSLSAYLQTPLLSWRLRFWYSWAEDYPERCGAEGILDSQGFCRQSHWPDAGSGKRNARGQRGRSARISFHTRRPLCALTVLSLFSSVFYSLTGSLCSHRQHLRCSAQPVHGLFLRGLPGNTRHWRGCRLDAASGFAPHQYESC